MLFRSSKVFEGIVGNKLAMDTSLISSMECIKVKVLSESIAFITVIFGQDAAAVISTILSVIVIRKCGSLCFHINCKILMTSLLLFYIAHSLFIITLQTTQLVHYIAYKNPCDMGLSRDICFSLRYPATVCMVACAVLQCAMVIERGVALSKREKYEQYGSKMGLTFVVVAIILSMALCLWAMQPNDFAVRSSYCSSATVSTSWKIMVLCFGLCGVDVITLLGIFFLYTFNDAALKRKIFHLHVTYQLRENSRVIRFIFPLTLFQTICYACSTACLGMVALYHDYISFLAYNILFAGAYIIPYYTMIAPIITWFIIKWSQQLRETKLKALQHQNSNEKDVYFKTYANMWK
ncbi:unnamed protein product [Cylicocyclus nassatus]|uniref:Uncharacterized protein n=1 Tax=Cylicocyclus nassatus TaxID=53992 RepID=A0AA36M1R4_CYLNA|nr:unnamed protein product [Cylicocyclus nassatus]